MTKTEAVKAVSTKIEAVSTRAGLLARAASIAEDNKADDHGMQEVLDLMVAVLGIFNVAIIPELFSTIFKV